MNRDIKKQWVDALRSGEYAQTTRALKDDKGYCCLGVLTDLAIKSGQVPGVRWRARAKPLFETSIQTLVFENGAKQPKWVNVSGEALPFSVYQWAGLGSSNPSINSEPLSEYNDNLLFSFDQIADLIEESL